MRGSRAGDLGSRCCVKLYLGPAGRAASSTFFIDYMRRYPTSTS